MISNHSGQQFDGRAVVGHPLDLFLVSGETPEGSQMPATTSGSKLLSFIALSGSLGGKGTVRSEPMTLRRSTEAHRTSTSGR